MDVRSNRGIPWPALLIALLLAGLPLAGMLQLESPHLLIGGEHHRYLEYRKFWGGNPNELFSHWLDMFVMSGNALVLSGLITLETFLRARHPHAYHMTRAYALLAFLLSSVGGYVLDSRYGEGTALLVYPFGFAPVLLASYFLLARLAGRLRWQPLLVIPACLAHAGLHVAAQYRYEPSETGAPNDLFGYLWLGSLIALALRFLWDPGAPRLWPGPAKP